jgi:hypothetical protein
MTGIYWLLMIGCLFLASAFVKSEVVHSMCCFAGLLGAIAFVCACVANSP